MAAAGRLPQPPQDLPPRRNGRPRHRDRLTSRPRRLSGASSARRASSPRGRGPDGCGGSSRSFLQRRLWTAPSNAPDPHGAERVVRVTHPFHPWHGRSYEFVVRRKNWGGDRVYFRDEAGEVVSAPTAWTDAGGEDPFVVL
ncbi:DUF5372 family protein, partial [Streptomyces chartreusis]